jgi:flagellin
MANNASLALSQSESSLATSLQRLSTGSKITSAMDDPAGTAVANSFGAQIARIGAAQSNISDSISFNQTQDGYLQQVSSALSQMSALSVQAQDTTKSSSDLSDYNAEFQKLGSFINDIATKDFNGVSLFSGTTQNVTTDSEGHTVATAGVNLAATTYTDATGAAVDTSAHAVAAQTKVTAAISQLSTDEGNIGANEAVLTSYNNTLSVLSNNLSSASSQITDVNVATESTTFAKLNILVQSGTAMLAQANQLPQMALKLIGG